MILSMVVSLLTGIEVSKQSWKRNTSSIQWYSVGDVMVSRSECCGFRGSGSLDDKHDEHRIYYFGSESEPCTRDFVDLP
jgi:hypothetical protein